LKNSLTSLQNYQYSRLERITITCFENIDLNFGFDERHYRVVQQSEPLSIFLSADRIKS